MELRQLKYFVALAEELHFGRAAERLHIARPAVSQQLARLEREVGVRLVERSSRSVRLTGAGDALLVRARRVLSEVDATHALAHDLVRGEAGQLRVGATDSLGWRLQRTLVAFRAERSSVHVTVRQAGRGENVRALEERQLDVAVVRAPLPARGVNSLFLWDEPMYAVMPARHPLAAQEAVALSALARMPVTLAPRSQEPGAHDQFLDQCRSAGFEPVLGATCATAEEALANIAASDDTWTLFPDSHAAVTTVSEVPGVACRALDPPLTTSCSLTWRAGDTSPVTAAFVALARRLAVEGALAAPL